MTWLDVARAAIVLAFGALAVGLGGPLATSVFRRVDRQIAQSAPEDQPLLPDQGLVAARHQLRGGTWVGMLERLAVFAGLIAHYPEAIMIALAIKGLARYPELTAANTGAAERFIIGTFVSVLLACGCAGLALFLTGLF